MASYDDLNTRQIWIVGVISAVLTAVTILAVQVLYFALLNWHEEAKLAGAEYTQSIAHIQQQEEALSQYGRNPETKAIMIPIDRAMELVAERSGADDQPVPPTEKKADNEHDAT